jgi:ABC-type multidrug transport system fused ATPase/permease subunit
MARRCGRVSPSPASGVRVVALFVSSMTLSAFGAVAVVLWFGGRLVMDQELSVGELASFILYTLLVAMALSALGDLWADFVRAGRGVRAGFRAAGPPAVHWVGRRR